MWVRRIELRLEVVFSGLCFFNEPENIRTRGPQLELPPGELVLRTFVFWKKSIDLSQIWTRKTLGPEVSTLPWDYRDRK